MSSSTSVSYVLGIQITNFLTRACFYSVHRTSVQETEEVFEPEYCKGCETKCEVEAPVESVAEEQATQDNQDNVQQVDKKPYHLGI